MLTRSPDCDRYVLDQILSGDMTEIVVENIHEYLRSVGENIRAERIKLEDYIIFKVCKWFWGLIETHIRLLLNPESFFSAWERVRRITRMEIVNPTCRSH